MPHIEVGRSVIILRPERIQDQRRTGVRPSRLKSRCVIERVGVGVIEIEEQVAKPLPIGRGQRVVIRISVGPPRGQSSILGLEKGMRPDVGKVLHVEHGRGPVVGVRERILINGLGRGDTGVFRRAQVRVHSGQRE